MGQDTKHSKAIYGHLMVLGTILIYSFNTNFMKHVMPEWIGPYGLTLARCMACAIGFSVICLFLPKETRNAAKGKDRWMLMLGGLIGMAGNMFFYILGISKTGPVDAFVIRVCQPIMVMALSILFLHQQLTWNKVVGICLGIGGTIYITSVPHSGLAEDSLLGDILVFTSSFMYAVYLILIKPYTTRFNSFVVLKWMSIAATIVIFPIGIDELIHAKAWTEPFHYEIWSEIAFTLIASTMIANLLTINALKYIPPFVDSAYIYLLPITGTIVSVEMGLQQFSWHDVFAFVLILSGFILINISKDSKILHPRFPQHLH